MNIADRIQSLRRGKGISQEELADKIGVSRQAVSKWESEQCSPDLDKIIIMSEYFGVTTDFLLKGIESQTGSADKADNETASRVLYIGSAAFIAIGLLCACSGWYAEQSAESIWGSVIIQVLGVAGYAVGRFISRAKAPLFLNWLNIGLALFLPLSLLVTKLFGGTATPYPTDAPSGIAFAAAYTLTLGVAFVLLKIKRK